MRVCGFGIFWLKKACFFVVNVTPPFFGSFLPKNSKWKKNWKITANSRKPWHIRHLSVCRNYTIRALTRKSAHKRRSWCGGGIGRFRTRSSFNDEQHLLSYVPRSTGEDKSGNRRSAVLWQKENAGRRKDRSPCVKTKKIAIKTK